jgi:hypothetical protein
MLVRLECIGFIAPRQSPEAVASRQFGHILHPTDVLKIRTIHPARQKEDRASMKPRRRANGTATAFVLVVAVVVAVSATVAVWYSSTSTNSGSSPMCNQPSYLVRLVSQIEGTQTFAQQSHGLSYVLAYGSNDSAETGTSDGKPIWYPPKTELALYSYGTSLPAGCPSTLGPKGVVGALWIRVPINANGSYNLANMTIYFTSGAPHFNNTSA